MQIRHMFSVLSMAVFVVFCASSLFASEVEKSEDVEELEDVEILEIQEFSSTVNPITNPSTQSVNIDAELQVRLVNGCHNQSSNKNCKIKSVIKVFDAAGAQVTRITSSIQVPSGSPNQVVKLHQSLRWNLQSTICGVADDGVYEVELISKYKKTKLVDNWLPPFLSSIYRFVKRYPHWYGDLIAWLEAQMQTKKIVRVIETEDEDFRLVIDRFTASSCVLAASGGIVEVTDPQSPIYKASIDIPPGGGIDQRHNDFDLSSGG